MAALRGLCISPEYRAVVVREGILDPLVLMSRSEEISVLREVAASLNNLSSIEENKLEISDRAMCTIIGLMLSGKRIQWMSPLSSFALISIWVHYFASTPLCVMLNLYSRAPRDLCSSRRYDCRKTRSVLCCEFDGDVGAE